MKEKEREKSKWAEKTKERATGFAVKSFFFLMVSTRKKVKERKKEKE